MISFQLLNRFGCGVASGSMWGVLLFGLVLSPGCKSPAFEGTLFGEQQSAGEKEKPEGNIDTALPEPFRCEPEGMEVSKAGVRRLQTDQYEQSLSVWLGIDEPIFDFELANSGIVTALTAEKIGTAANRLANESSNAGDRLLQCKNRQASEQRDCALVFLESFGGNVFRRPVDSEEKAWLNGLYDVMLPELGFEDTASAFIEVVLQSPQALYILEKGQEAPGLEEGVRALDGFERASRLALFLWNQALNEALLEKAKAGLLDTDEGVRETARQMLKEPMAATVVKKFIVDLLGLNGGMILPALEQIEKDSERFPQFDEDLLKAMRTEIEAFAEKVLLSDGGSYRALWDNNQAYVNRELAELYGVGFDTSGEEFQWLDLPNNQRAGLLTRAAFLALYAHSSHQSPILRGAHILSDVFCQPPGSPPPDVDDSPIAPKKFDASTVSFVRDSMTERTQGPECEGCHIWINNIGFAFDHYDVLGVW